MRSFFLLVALCAFMVSFGSVSAIGRTQSVAVQGHLICKGIPAQDIKVKIFDEGIVLDTNLDEEKTNAIGDFHLAGSTSEISDIDPKINIYHKCDWPRPCDRKFTIDLPKSYITVGDKPEKIFDVGTINLEDKFPRETTDCIN